MLSGIGFVGIWAVMKSPEGASGLSTAVSLWGTGAIGAGVAYGRPLMAAALSLMSGLASWGPSLGSVEKGDLMSGWEEFPRILLSLAVALALGIPIGWDRERQGFGPGLRTYPLLAMGACAYLEIGQIAFHDHVEGQARVFQALVSGIGFIGAGAIIKGRAEVHGLATAVTLWITVSVGIAASYRLFALAAVLSGTTLVALHVLKPLKRHPEEADKGPDPDESR